MKVIASQRQIAHALASLAASYVLFDVFLKDYSMNMNKAFLSGF